RASDLTGKLSLTFKNVDGINDLTIEPVQLTQDGKVKAGMGLGALAEAINKSSDKSGIKASVSVISVFEEPIKAGKTTSNFAINGVTIGSVEVKDKDGNNALVSAINAVTDQTGVKASVDTKGRLVLSNNDGRGIQVTDNITTTKPANDIHNLVVQGTQNTKVGVDLNDTALWGKAGGTTGSILNKDNSFGDVVTAHNVQDALIYEDGFKQARNEAVAHSALNTFKDEQSKALENLKKDLVDTINTNILEKAAADTKETDKVTLDTAARKAIADINKAGDLKAVSDALTTLTGSANKFYDATIKDGGLVDTTKTAFAKSVKTYSTKVESAAVDATNTMKNAGIDIDKENSTAKTFNDALTTFAGKLATANKDKAELGSDTAATAFGAIATLAGADNTFNTAVKDEVGKDLNFKDAGGKLEASANGALNLLNGNNAAFANGANPALVKDVKELFTALKEQTTLEGANGIMDKLTSKLGEIVNAAAGKTMESKEAQQGIVAHALLKFYDGVKAGLNEPTNEGLSSIIGLNTENSTNMGRISFSSTNGRDIVVEAKDANGFTTNSAIGFDKNVVEKTISLRETNSTIDKEL
ncbi:hypothetical protein AVCANL277_08895, partial [Campylobacter canadensis]